MALGHISDPSREPAVKKGVDKRMVAIVLAFAAAGALVTASFSKSWMGNPKFSGLVRDSNGKPTDAGGRYFALAGDIRFGPLGFERCGREYRGFEMHETERETTCMSLSNAEFNTLIGELDPQNRDKYTSGAFGMAGRLALVACLFSAVMLMATAGLALARKRKELPISPASLALLGLLGAMATGCVFIATKPGPGGMLGIDIGFWAFGGGTVIGMLAAQMLAKEIRPADPDLLEGALSPDELAAFPTSFARPAAQPAPAPMPGVPLPLPPVPPTQPVEVLPEEMLAPPPAAASAGSAANEANEGDGAGDSAGGSGDRGDVSA